MPHIPDIDHEDSAKLLGWATSKEVLKAPAKDFGYGIIYHYIPKNDLHSIEDLKKILL